MGWGSQHANSELLGILQISGAATRESNFIAYESL